jgi:hypothetical protein
MRLGKYTALLRKRGPYEPSFCYLMDTFLQSRIATRNESNRDFYDEDVNVYLALLLNSVVTDRFHRTAARYIAKHESDLWEILDHAENVFAKREIYRANADFLLLQNGVFHVPSEDALSQAKVAASVERGRAYYRFACAFADHLPSRHRPVTEVLAKLSYDFDKYRRVLTHMRGAFLDLVPPLSGHDVARIREDMEEHRRAERLAVLQDRLLDAYLEHRRMPSEENRARMSETLQELRTLDPNAWPGFSVALPHGAEGHGPQ